MKINVSHNGVTIECEVPDGAELGHVRSMENQLEEIGAPSSFTLAIDHVGQDDTVRLREGCTVTFRPKEGSKGFRESTAALAA